MTQAFEQRLALLEELSWGSGEDGGWRQLGAALLDMIATCADAEQLRRVLGCGGVADLTYLEGGLEPAHVAAILARAAVWSTADDIACAIGLAVRTTAFDPGAVLVLDATARGDKEHLFSVLDAGLHRFRDGLDHAHESVRAACAHALARCGASTVDDVHTLLALADGEPHGDALASKLLAAASIARRCSHPLDPRRFSDWLAHDGALVRTCAVAATALVGGAIDRQGGTILAAALDEPLPLPVGWGWCWRDSVESSQAIAVRVLSWKRCEEPEIVIPALARLRGDTLLEGDALFLQAFPQGSIPELGFTAGELSASQRLALAAFAKPGFGERRGLLAKLGLHLAADVTLMLAGEGALWRPHAVATGDGFALWHMPRIWRATIAGSVTESSAVDAIVAGSAPGEVVEAICAPRRGPLLAKNASNDELRERDRLLATAVFERLVANGFDLAKQVEAMRATATRWHPTFLAIAQRAASSSS